MKSILALLLLITFVTKAQNDSSVIRVYNGVKNIFPYSWLNGKIKIKATVPDNNNIGIDTTEIQKALNKYPIKILQRHLRYVYLVGSLRFYGVYFSGTNSSRDVYIASNNKSIEKTFHHEFSSILLRFYSYDFDAEKWKKLSPELLNTTDADALKRGYNSSSVDSTLLEKGYLDLYSLSNLENDFNMYAENIFAGGKDFWKMVDRYPLVKEKTLLTISFYTKIDPILTEAYFRYLVD